MVVQHSDHASEDQVQSRQWAVLRAFMDPKEAALLDSLLSSRTLNPDITVFPLHFAAAEGDLGTIKKLLEKPHAKSGNTLSKVRETFDVNQSFMDLPRGSTPLQWAAAKQYTSIVSYLLSKGANVNQPTRKGQTALHLACAVNHLETIQKLVHSGADTEARDEAGKTPRDLLQDNDWSGSQIAPTIVLPIDLQDHNASYVFLDAFLRAAESRANSMVL